MKFWSNSDVPPPGGAIPELRLLAAVLQRAIHDFLSGDGEFAKELEHGLWTMSQQMLPFPLSSSVRL